MYGVYKNNYFADSNWFSCKSYMNYGSHSQSLIMKRVYAEFKLLIMLISAIYLDQEVRLLTFPNILVR